MRSKGNHPITRNFPKRGGRWGYRCTNWAIQNARGKYFIFFANDDEITTNHCFAYLHGIENTDYDLVYYNSLVRKDDQVMQRYARIGHSRVGHTEIIVRTDLARKAPPHDQTYRHDWNFIY